MTEHQPPGGFEPPGPPDPYQVTRQPDGLPGRWHPEPADPFRSPPQAAAPVPPRRGVSPWLLFGVIGVGLGLVAALFIGRFAWQQFAQTPVVPDTLMGMPRLVGAEIDEQVEAIRREVGQDLTAGSATRVGLYTDGQGTGYVVMALRGGARPGRADDADMTGWTQSQQDGATCWSQSATVPGGVAVSYCVRGFFRRSVAVFAVGATPPDPFVVAQATREVWDAQ